MIYRPSKNLTLVVYEDQRPTQCFQIQKGQIKFLTLLVPMLVMAMAITVLFVIAYMKTLNSEVHKGPPPIINTLTKENARLLERLKEQENLNQSLLAKIQTPSSGKAASSFLSFFRPVLGQVNHSGDSTLTISNLKTKSTNDTTVLTFDLVNTSSEQSKISGHIFVLMKENDTLYFFPNINLDMKSSFLTSYEKGETFTVTRFRPVEAAFQRPGRPGSASSFKIYIFSKTGDLLLDRSIGPAEIK